MDSNSAREKVKKEKNDKILFKNYVHNSNWANEQTLKTDLRIPFYLFVHAFFYY